MHFSEYRRIEEVENIHFWYRAMEEAVIDMISRLTGNGNRIILDAGCGTGGLSKKLLRFGDVYGLDINKVALDYARQKGLTRVVSGSVESLPFGENKFDIVVCLDVLYHRKVNNDRKAIRELYRVLKPEGFMVLRLPAFESLRGNHDRIVETRHRYTVSEIRKKLEAAGFEIENLSYANVLLSLPLFIKRFIERKHLSQKFSSDTVLLPGIVNELMYRYLKLENKLLTFISFPYGSSVVCLARKKEKNKDKGQPGRSKKKIKRQTEMNMWRLSED